jgi:hypothetical protein
MNIKNIKIDVFSANVTLIISDSMEEISEYVKNTYDIEDIDSTDSIPFMEGFVLSLDTGKFVMAIGEKHLTYNTITHELYHLATAILSRINIEDEETSAWLIGFLAEKVYQHLDKSGLQVKIKNGRG